MKKLLLKTMLLLCALIVGSGSVWATEYSVTLSSTVKMAAAPGLTSGGVTWIADATGGATIGNYQSGYTGQQFGTGSTQGYVTFSTSGISGTITSVVVSCQTGTKGGGTVAVSVGGTSYGSAQSMKVATAGTGSTPGDLTFSGSSSGEIIITMTQTAKKALYLNSITVTYTTGDVTPTCATPTFSPAEGTYTSTQNVTISTATDGATIYYTTDGTDPTTSSSVYSSAISVSTTTTIKAIAVKSGLSNSDVATATYTISTPYTGDEYVRVTSLDYLTDGAKVIIAARYNSTATSYYAMTATTSGKPTGVSFASGSSSNGETIPSTILATSDSEDTYSWTVEKKTSTSNNVTTTTYRFINANDDILGYGTSGTDFTKNGTNDEWKISRETSGSSAMVSGYEGFYIVNKTQTGRAVALNDSHNYGPYSTGNNNSSSYNFYLDIFVKGATPNSNPSLAADDVDIAYNGTSGSISYMLNNSKTGGAVTASITSGNTENWLSIGNPSNSNASGTVALTCAANAGAERTATVTLTYTYDTDKTVTKEVSVTQAGDPNYVPTISEVRAQGTGSVTTKGIVTSCVGTTGYIQDANAAICVFGSELTVGNEIKVSGTLSTYSGLLEITSPTIDETISTGNTVTPEVMTIAEVNASTKQGWLVTIEDATVSAIDGQNVTIAQSKNTIVVRFSATPDNFSVNDVITLTGNIGCYSNTPQIANPTDVSVTVNNDPIITPASFTVEATATTDLSGTINVTYENITTVAADVAFYASDGTTSATYNWLTATINSTTNNLEYTISENTSTTARTAYLKVWAYDDDFNEVYSGLITVTQAGAVVDYATLPFSYDNNALTANLVDGLTSSGITDKYNSSPKIKFDTTDDYVILKLNEAPSCLSFDIKGQGNGTWSGTFDVLTSTDGVDYSTTLQQYTSLSTSDVSSEVFALASTVRYIKWVFTSKTSGFNVALGNIRVNYEKATVSDAGYATFASDYALDFTGSDIKAYIAEPNGTTGVTFSQVNKIPANTGVLLYKDGGATEYIPVTTESTDYMGNNAFVRGTGATVASVSGNLHNYILNKVNDVVGFYMANDQIVATNRAYIQIDESIWSSVKEFISLPGFDGDDTTGIITIDDETMDNAIYNLAGQRLNRSQLKRGIYIVNGKKVLVK